ncbi:MAG: hypothetical protein IKQ61_05135 [Spirochaetales bacterium]|nr:hypothetical protein [Spirochaetales bacterium]
MAKEKKPVEEETVTDAAEEAKKEAIAQLDQVKAFFTEQMSKLDAQVKDISNNLKNKYVPQAETKIKENLITSLLVSFGAGLCLGLTLMIMSFFGGKKR